MAGSQQDLQYMEIPIDPIIILEGDKSKIATYISKELLRYMYKIRKTFNLKLIGTENIATLPNHTYKGFSDDVMQYFSKWSCSDDTPMPIVIDLTHFCDQLQLQLLYSDGLQTFNHHIVYYWQKRNKLFVEPPWPARYDGSVIGIHCFLGLTRLSCLRKTKCTFICNAVDELREDVLHLLINFGANVNVTDEKGKTPLFYAVENQKQATAGTAPVETGLHYENMLNLLINAGANVDPRDSTGKKPLFYSIQTENEVATNILVNAGATLDVTQDADSIDYLLSLTTDNPNIFRLLTRVIVNVDTCDSNGNTPLFYQLHDETTVRLLLDAGANVNAVDLDDKIILSHAVPTATENTISALIDAGANVNYIDKNGWTPLFYALDNEKNFHVLIHAGAKVNMKDNGGKTLLFHALDKEDRVQLLINAGIDVNSKDKNGKTALYYALFNENVAHLLINAGADITDSEGKTILFHAKDKAEIKLVVESKVDVNHKDKEGNVVLFQWLDDEEIVRYLVSNGADVNTCDNEGRTALFFTTNAAIAQFLIQKGADVNARDFHGQTALYHTFEANSELARVLLENSARVDVTDKCGMSVKSFAIHKIIQNGFNNSSDKTFGMEELQLLTNNLNTFFKNGELFQCIIDGLLCKCLEHFNILTRLKHRLFSTRFFGGFQKALEVAALQVEKDTGDKVKIEKLLGLLSKISCSSQPQVQAGILVCKSLVDLGANPNAPDLEGNAALFYAVVLPFNGVPPDDTMSVCRLLDKHGSVAWIKNYNGDTPLLFLLSNYQWDPSTFKVYKEGDDYCFPIVDICKLLVNAGSSAREITKSGECVYHLILRICERGLLIRNNSVRKYTQGEMENMLEFFSSHAATRGTPPVNTRDYSHLNTPLHRWASLLARLNNDVRKQDVFNQFLSNIFKLLLRCGAKINDLNLLDETPLHLCRTWCAVKLLLEAGANPQVLNAEGDTPLLAQLKRLQVELKNEKTSSKYFSDVYPDASKFELEP